MVFKMIYKVRATATKKKKKKRKDTLESKITNTADYLEKERENKI